MTALEKIIKAGFKAGCRFEYKDKSRHDDKVRILNRVEDGRVYYQLELTQDVMYDYEATIFLNTFEPLKEDLPLGNVKKNEPFILKKGELYQLNKSSHSLLILNDSTANSYIYVLQFNKVQAYTLEEFDAIIAKDDQGIPKSTGKANINDIAIELKDEQLVVITKVCTNVVSYRDYREQGITKGISIDNFNFGIKTIHYDKSTIPSTPVKKERPKEQTPLPIDRTLRLNSYHIGNTDKRLVQIIDFSKDSRYVIYNNINGGSRRASIDDFAKAYSPFTIKDLKEHSTWIKSREARVHTVVGTHVASNSLVTNSNGNNYSFGFNIFLELFTPYKINPTAPTKDEYYVNTDSKDIIVNPKVGEIHYGRKDPSVRVEVTELSEGDVLTTYRNIEDNTVTMSDTSSFIKAYEFHSSDMTSYKNKVFNQNSWVIEGHTVKVGQYYRLLKVPVTARVVGIDTNVNPIRIVFKDPNKKEYKVESNNFLKEAKLLDLESLIVGGRYIDGSGEVRIYKEYDGSTDTVRYTMADSGNDSVSFLHAFLNFYKPEDSIKPTQSAALDNPTQESHNPLTGEHLMVQEGIEEPSVGINPSEIQMVLTEGYEPNEIHSVVEGRMYERIRDGTLVIVIDSRIKEVVCIVQEGDFSQPHLTYDLPTFMHLFREVEPNCLIKPYIPLKDNKPVEKAFESIKVVKTNNNQKTIPLKKNKTMISMEYDFEEEVIELKF